VRLKEKVAIVTGGASGIGRETCKLLAREGAKIMVADLVIKEADKVIAEVKELGSEAMVMKVDVTNFEESHRMAKAALDNFGQIDILANVAGGSMGPVIKTKMGPFAQSSKERWDDMISLNLYGAFNCTRAVINHMIERHSGKIVNFASLAGVIGMENNVEYSAAKAGIIGFTKALAKEVARYGINVNSISPGTVGTARFYGMPEESRSKWAESVSLGRVAKPQEIASVVLFLVSDESGYVTGENIVVDGCIRPTMY